MEEIVVCKAWVANAEMNDSFKLNYSNPSILKSLIFLAEPLLGEPKMIGHQVSRFFDVREDGSNLTTLWCNFLELHNSPNVNNLTSVAWDTPEFQLRPPPISILHPGLQLGHLESYWEPEPILMGSVLDSPTKLKLISCFYRSENFQNFSENHPLLEVLKLCFRWAWNVNDQIRAVGNEDSWKNLSKLRIISLKSFSNGKQHLAIGQLSSCY